MRRSPTCRIVVSSYSSLYELSAHFEKITFLHKRFNAGTDAFTWKWSASFPLAVDEDGLIDSAQIHRISLDIYSLVRRRKDVIRKVISIDASMGMLFAISFEGAILEALGKRGFDLGMQIFP